MTKLAMPDFNRAVLSLALFVRDTTSLERFTTLVTLPATSDTPWAPWVEAAATESTAPTISLTDVRVSSDSSLNSDDN